MSRKEALETLWSQDTALGRQKKPTDKKAWFQCFTLYEQCKTQRIGNIIVTKVNSKRKLKNVFLPDPHKSKPKTPKTLHDPNTPCRIPSSPRELVSQANIRRQSALPPLGRTEVLSTHIGSNQPFYSSPEVPCSADTSSPPVPHYHSHRGASYLACRGVSTFDLHMSLSLSPKRIFKMGSHACFQGTSTSISLWLSYPFCAFPESTPNGCHYYFFIIFFLTNLRHWKLFWKTNPKAKISGCFHKLQWTCSTANGVRTSSHHFGEVRDVGTLLTVQQRLFWVISHSRINKSSGCKAETLLQIQKWKTRVITDWLVLSFKIAQKYIFCYIFSILALRNWILIKYFCLNLQTIVGDIALSEH